ncbi:MAG: PD40 domain-containing protein [Bryobacterales bacterium]|nr:PD40 domain-containing protein [Bryobacterales bacterium]
MMAKNPAERPAASEVESRLRLLECAPSPSPESATTSLSRRGLFAAALGGAVLSGTVAARWWPGKSSNPDSPLASAPFQLNFPPGLELMSSFGPTVAISANGQVLGALLGAAPDKPSAVHLWRSGAREPLRVPGTEGANSFFLSPAGDSLAVRQHGTLYRIDRNGAKTRLAPISFGPESGIWADDGALYYSSAHPREPGRLTTVWRLPSDGASRPEALLADDHPELGALYLLVLQILPDGRHLLVSESRSSFRTLFAFDLKTRTRKTLLEGVNGGHYLPTGHVLHHRGINLYAQRLNESNLSVSGAPVLVQRGVAQASWSGGNLSLSRLGTLVYQPRDREISDRTLVWVDRNGQETSLGLPPGPHEPSAISPDGAHVLIRRYDAEEGNWSLWMLTLRSAEWIELATGLSAPGEAVWSPDGNEIIYHLPTGLSRRRVFPLGPPTVITRESRLAHHPAHLFPGHHSLLISQGYQPVITASVLSIPLNPAGGRLDTVLQAHLHPALSADGRWLATSRRDRIYIQPFPIRPDARLLDAGEGGSPIWSADGRWLYWRAGRRIVAARFSAHDPPRLSPSRVIAEGDFLPYTKWLRMIAFCNKSQRFLLARNWRPEPPARSLQVVPDFMAKVRQLCPP